MHGGPQLRPTVDLRHSRSESSLSRLCTAITSASSSKAASDLAFTSLSTRQQHHVNARRSESYHLRFVNRFICQVNRTSPHRSPELHSQSRNTRPTSLDQKFVDFDSVRYHISTPTKKSILLLSMHVRCWDELVQYGVNDIMAREYGAYIIEDTEEDYSISLMIDCDSLPEAGGKLVVSVISLMPRC